MAKLSYVLAVQASRARAVIVVFEKKSIVVFKDNWDNEGPLELARFACKELFYKLDTIRMVMLSFIVPVEPKKQTYSCVL
jgi:hypothetical protein